MRRWLAVIAIVSGALISSGVFAQGEEDEQSSEPEESSEAEQSSEPEESSRLPFTLELRSVGVVDGRVEAVVVARNDGEGDIQLLIWDTPFEGFVSEDFSVTRDGDEVPFLGIVAKRGEPVEEDWLTLAAGEEQTATVDLAEVFDMSQAGEYGVGYAPALHGYASGSEISSRGDEDEGALEPSQSVELPVQSMSLSISEDSGVSAAFLPDQVSTRAGAPTYHDCSADEEKTVKAALKAGLAFAKDAQKDLKAGSSSSPSARYKKWFGTATSSRYSTATSHFDKISSTLESEPLRMQCKPSGCKSSWYAYVHGNDASWNVYLCSAFWKAGTSGSDTQGGTLVHEVSHFDKVADTDDIEYGQAPCRKLATDAPDKALKNADNHEYYSENP